MDGAKLYDLCILFVGVFRSLCTCVYLPVCMHVFMLTYTFFFKEFQIDFHETVTSYQILKEKLSMSYYLFYLKV